MENPNSIEIPVEIKLDVGRSLQGPERHDFSNLRTWTQIICRMEFVKTFPCFMKLTLITPKNDDSKSKETLVLRINIPGLIIQVATSRTKEYSYGLFWKANRKRCCVFLSFFTKYDFEQHMQWVKYWIKNLEYFRRDFLERRSKKEFNSITIDTNESLSSNINNTQNVKDIREILGPLPSIPDSLDENWLKRQSTISGIYEEIGERGLKNMDSSVSSGLYEYINIDDREVDETLPQKVSQPRKRINTNEFGVSRSNTNTEVDFNKKKWSWTLQRVVSGFTRKFDSTEKLTKTPIDDFHNEKLNVSCRRNFKPSILKSNRNSFSTPDLSQLPDTFINCERGDCNASIEFLNISFDSISNDVDLLTNEKRVENICSNSSSINLLNSSDVSSVSCKSYNDNEPIYQIPKNIPIRLIDETSGYCFMGSPLKQRERPNAQENQENLNKNGPDYLRMDELRVELRKKQSPEPIYANIERKKTFARCSVDEKLPSYLPNNEYYLKQKYNSKQKVKTPEKNTNLYTPLPKRSNNIKGDLNLSYENAMLNPIKPATQYDTLPHLSTKTNFKNKPEIVKNRFGSLPRIRKFDFSPLRAKLNNVFLRYNNGQV